MLETLEDTSITLVYNWLLSSNPEISREEAWTWAQDRWQEFMGRVVDTDEPWTEEGVEGEASSCDYEGPSMALADK